LHPLSYFTDDDLDDFVNVQTNNYVELRDWQRRAIKFFKENNYNALFEASTGVGKSRCAVEIIKAVYDIDSNIRTLIVVPKNVILETGWYRELVEAGLPIQDIGVYYGNIKEYAKITLTNMQSLSKIPLELFQFLIIDEAHNFATPKLLKLISKPFKYRLGLTATVKRQDNKHYDLLKIFNYNVFEYSPAQALEEGVLNPFDFVSIGVYLDEETRDEYENLSQQYSKVILAGGGFKKIMLTTGPVKNKMLMLLTQRKQLVNNYKQKFDVTKLLITKHRNDKVIVFNQFIDQTNKMYWHLLDSNIEVRQIHSKLDKEERDKTLMDFKLNKYNVLIAAKVLDEGYNLPKLDVAIITAGDKEDKQTIQRMGRVLRKKDKNSTIYQIYCIETIEAEDAKERSNMLKKLAMTYQEIIYDPQDIDDALLSSSITTTNK
jgi:superfamily II DNA or RNA helicase